MIPDVLFEDNHLLVLNKPAGVLVQADRTGDADLLSAGKAYLKTQYAKPGNVFLGLVHRLDRPVSGVMVFARTSKAAARLSEQIRQRTPQKVYWAIVEGKVTGAGICEDYLLKEGERVQVVPSNHPKGLRAELDWKALTNRNGCSLLEIRLKTGRPHQIRVQLSSRGMPILGDLRYGARSCFDGRNLALHCRSMTVNHPTTQEKLTFIAPLPAVWATFFPD